MSEVKKYRADWRHVVETEFDDAQFVGIEDYKDISDRVGKMACAERQMSEELEIARDDLVIYKSSISALGEASKKLVMYARTTGGTPGPDQGLMDACSAVESAITIGGVARAMNSLEQLTADFDAQRLRADKAEAERDTERKIRESAEGGWREANRVIAMQRERLDADERRIAKLSKALKDLVWINEQHNRAIAQIAGTPTGWKDTYLDAARAALNPKPEAGSHDRLCPGCGAEGWTANCDQCIPY